MEKDHNLFIAFIDLKAAFDLVDHLALWSILKNMGVVDKLVNLLSKLYDGLSAVPELVTRTLPGSQLTVESGRAAQWCLTFSTVSLTS